MIATIRGRRSIREGFTGAPVPEEVIEEILHSGLCAPSSKNAQPWRLHVVTADATLREIADCVEHSKGAERYVPIDPLTGEPRPGLVSTVVESAEVLRQVSLGIFVESVWSFSGGREALAAAGDSERRGALVGFALDMLGIGALLQSMWLAAESHGLRGVFMGDVMIAERSIASLLGLEGDLLGVLALGYAPNGVAAPRRISQGRVVRHA